MSELKCDLTVDQIKIAEKEDETTYTAVLSGKMNGTAEVKVNVKTDGRDILEEYGIDEVGSKATIRMNNTNSRLDSFAPVDEDVKM